MKTIFGGDCFWADSRLGEGYVLGDFRVKVMADHEHVEVLVYGVDGERAGGIGGGGKDVELATDFDDVRSVSTAGAF